MKKHLLLSFLLLSTIMPFTAFAQHPGWSQYYIVERVTAVANDNNFIWVGSEQSGLVRINVETGEETYFNTANSALPSHMVKSISLDKSGTAYINTFRGIAVYDGNDWVVHDSLNSPLSTNNITGLTITPTGDLWVIEGDELLRLDSNGEWTVISQEETGLPGQMSAIAVDLDDNILVGAQESLGMFNGTSWSVENLQEEGMGTPGIITVDSVNKIWISQSVGIASKDPVTGEWKQYYSYNSELEVGYITSLAVSDNNHLLIGNGDFGLIEFENGEGNDTTWTKYGSPVDESLGGIMYGIAGIDGTIWAGGISGFFKLEDSTWSTFQLANAPIQNNTVYDVVVDQDNVKWFTPSGMGLLSFDGTTWKSYDTTNSEIPGNNIGALAVDEKRGRIWIGTDGGIATFDGETWTTIDSVSGLQVRSIAIADDGVAWIASIRGLESFDGNEWTHHEYIDNLEYNGSISDMVFDKTGKLWIATVWNGMVSYDGDNWVNYTPYNSDVPADWVLTVTVDSANIVWIGTNYNMLASFDGSDWTTYEVYKDPYYDNYVTAIAIDEHDTKWIGAQGSSSVYILLTFNDSITHIYTPYNSGSPLDRVHALAIDKQGTIWIASKGIYSYSPGVQVSNVKHQRQDIEINMFPNPTAGTIQFNTVENSVISEIDILEAGGRLIKSEKVNNNQGSLSIDDLPKGIYLIRIKTNMGEVVRKILKL